MLIELGNILYTVVLPFLLIAGIGFALQRSVGLDMPTLTRLSFHFILPAVMFSSLVGAEIGAAAIATVVAFTVFSMLLTAAVAYVATLPFRVPRAAVVMGASIQNAGNFGLTIQTLAFRSSGLADAATSLYSFYMVTQNVLTFTAGVALASSGAGDAGQPKGARTRSHALREAGRQMLRLPPVYAVAAGVVVMLIRGGLGEAGPGLQRLLDPFWQVIILVRSAFIGVAVLSLGAQLGTIRFQRIDHAALLAAILRLVAGPALGLATIALLGIRGFPAQVLLVGSANPTAVNVMLLCLQFRNNEDSAARMVLYTPLFSPLTVTLAIYAARSGLVG